MDLREIPGDVTFELLQEHRREVDPGLSLDGASKESNWAAVAAECEQALATRSKDLQLAAWLAEALARRQGFVGLCEGLGIVRALLERFWDGMHPGAGADGELDLGYRARWLNWLGGSREFLRAVCDSPILMLPGGSALAWTLYQNSQLVDEKRVLPDPSQYQALLAQGHVSGEEWQRRLGEVELSALAAAKEHVVSCEQALGELRAVCEKHFGSEQAPDLAPLAVLLSEIRAYLEARARVPEEAAAPDISAPDQATSQGDGASAPGAGPIRTREDALRRLREVADYYRRSEPHSPISYLVQRAVRWGQMPLDELLREVINNPDVLARIWETLGIEPGQSPKKN